MNATKAYLYDTTLRDGNQARGISFSADDKVKIAHILDDFGVDYIEGGWPNAGNPTDLGFFEAMKGVRLGRARLAAFGSTARPGTAPDKDAFLADLVKSEAPIKTIFGKSWDLHVAEVIRTTLDENLMMIERSVEYLKRYSDEVVYDAEHFFDGYKANPEYAIETLRAAMRGGANWIVLCDTNGGMACPWELEGIVKAVQAQITAPLGIHCHDDTGVAVANSLAAVHAGATQVQGVFNGYGERCGNANLATIAANLRFKMGAELQCAENFPRLRSVCQALDQVANMPEDHRAPYVGSSAFAHKGGAHIDGVMKVARSFEHIDPAAVGNARTFVTSDQAGGALIVGKLEGIAPNMDKKSPEVASLLDLVKQKEALGFAFDSAEASFLVLAKGHLGLFKPPFETISYRVIETGDCSASHISEATVKLRIACEVVHVVSEGDGPVNALDAALRKALAPHFPFLDLVKLGDFKVRVLGTNVGTDARVRVWTEFSDGEEEWNTAGVSTNIIEASWNALLDGINYKIMKHR